MHRDDGRLANPGYASSLLLGYDRARIKAPRWRIKEWDYYLINDDDFAVALTLGDLGYMGLLSASVMDLKGKSFKTSSINTLLPLGSFKMPADSSSGLARFTNKRVSFSFEAQGGVRRIKASFKRFEGEDDLEVEAVLSDQPRDTMVIATPWKEDPLAFYYNQKIIGMKAQGSFTKGGLAHHFSPEESFGLLDWGRGVWTHDNSWFWAAAQGWQDGKGQRTPGSHRFGLNLGYGFGDTSAASENMAFIDGAMHKLGKVDFGIPPRKACPGRPPKGVAGQYALMEPWHVQDDEGRLDLVFTPTLDRFDFINLGLVISDQHQVFGTYDGHVVIEGERFLIKGLIGAAEVVHNKY
ncbi:MAG: DUF2804 domain-containing protein [Coriobacteriaceae bacterium]|nr:DUF2804 domain-containing protein [Coriobacteriaceae bacterium]